MKYVSNTLESEVSYLAKECRENFINNLILLQYF